MSDGIHRINETVNDRDGNSVSGTRIVDTTVGRALLFQVVPKGLSYDVVNLPMKVLNWLFKFRLTAQLLVLMHQSSMPLPLAQTWLSYSWNSYSPTKVNAYTPKVALNPFALKSVTAYRQKFVPK